MGVAKEVCLSRNLPAKKDPGKDAGRHARPEEAEPGTDGTAELGKKGWGMQREGFFFLFFFAGKYMTHFHFLQNSSGCVILTAHGLNMATSKL